MAKFHTCVNHDVLTVHSFHQRNNITFYCWLTIAKHTMVEEMDTTQTIPGNNISQMIFRFHFHGKNVVFFFSAENNNGAIVKAKKKFIHPKKSAEERKLEKEKRKLRKARVILRNLPFKVNENDLKTEFAKYGAIKECNILKREDGKLIGCAFIQYDKVNHAAKAIHHANGKEMFGRPVIIDWAVNRKKFVQHLRQQKESNKKSKIKTEDHDGQEMEIKQESEDENSEQDDDGNEDDDEEENDEVDGGNDSDSEAVDSDEDEDVKDEKKPIHQKSNDVAEGCTVFIKNIPFDSTNEDLYKVCRQFGPLHYAVITVDKISGHSKGNGFAKYKVNSFVLIFNAIRFV